MVKKRKGIEMRGADPFGLSVSFQSTALILQSAIKKLEKKKKQYVKRQKTLRKKGLAPKSIKVADPYTMSITGTRSVLKSLLKRRKVGKGK